MGRLAAAFFNAVIAGSFNADSEINSAKKPEQCLCVSSTRKQPSRQLASKRDERKELH